jgi:hypothetical protein
MKPKKPELVDVSIKSAQSDDDTQGLITITVTNSSNDPVVAPIIVESNVPLEFWHGGKKLAPGPVLATSIPARVPKLSHETFDVQWKDPTDEIKFIQLRARFKSRRSREVEVG